jgi:hypothetical protein
MARQRRLKLEHLETRTLLATLQGDVFEDANGNQTYEQFIGDSKIPGWTVFLDANQNGQLDGESVEPDDFPFFENLNVVNPHVTLLKVDSANQPRAFGDVEPRADVNRSTGNLVFDGFWNTNTRLRADFTNSVSWVALDANGGNGVMGRLEVYNSNDQLLTSIDT